MEARRQRNTREENAVIKAGGIPEAWKAEDPRTRHKFAQKDTSARWTIKGGKRFFGYKNHIKIDAESLVITKYAVTPANVHDSQALLQLADDSDRKIYADSAYAGKALAAQLPPCVTPMIMERAARGKPLTDEQKRGNREKSKTRVRIEHVFAFIKRSGKKHPIRCVGQRNAECIIGLRNLLFNMYRYVVLLLNA